MTLLLQRTSLTSFSPVMRIGLFKARPVGLDPIPYIDHLLARWADKHILVFIIGQLVRGIGCLAFDPFALLPIELAVLYIGCDPPLLQPPVVLLAPVTCIRRDVGRLYTIVPYMFLYMSYQCSGIGGI